MNVISGVVGTVLPGTQAEAARQGEPAQTETFGVAMLLALLSSQSLVPNVSAKQAPVDGANVHARLANGEGADETVPTPSVVTASEGQPTASKPVMLHGVGVASQDGVLGQAIAGPLLAYSRRSISPDTNGQSHRAQAAVAPQSSLPQGAAPLAAAVNGVHTLPNQLAQARSAAVRQTAEPQRSSTPLATSATTQKTVIQRGAGLPTQSLTRATIPMATADETAMPKPNTPPPVIRQVATDATRPNAPLAGVKVESLEVATAPQVTAARLAAAATSPSSTGAQSASGRDASVAATLEPGNGTEQPSHKTAPVAEQTQAQPAMAPKHPAVKPSRSTVSDGKLPQVGDKPALEATDAAIGSDTVRRRIVRPSRPVSHRSVGHSAAAKSHADQAARTLVGQMKQGARGEADGSSNSPAHTRALGVEAVQSPAALRVAGGPERAGVTNAAAGAEKAHQTETMARTGEPLLRPNPADRVTLKFTDEQGVEGRVRVAVRGQAVRATIVSDDPAVARRLGSDLGELQQALDRQGFRDAHIAVQQAKRADVNGVIMAASGRPTVDAPSTATGSRGAEEQGTRDRPQQDQRDSHSSNNGRSQQRSRQRQER